MLIHLLVSIVYAMIIAPIVNGFRPILAGIVGGVIGLILYFINYAVFGFLFDLQQRKAQTIADVLGEEGFARNLSKADLEYLFAED